MSRVAPKGLFDGYEVGVEVTGELSNAAVDVMQRSMNRRTSSAREMPSDRARSASAASCRSSRYKFVRCIHHCIYQLGYEP